MASFSAGTTFTDGVPNDVTAAKLGALVNNATPLSGLIQDRTAETITATNDTLLIGDASDSNNLKRITVANFAQTLPTAKITTGTVVTGTFGTTTSTAASVTGDLTIADKIVHSGDTNTTIRFPAADTVTVETSGAERLRVDSSGNVGIGTASPSVKLEVAGITRIGSGNDYQFDSTLKINAESTGTTGYLRFYTNSDERLRIDSSGNVGIGTTSIGASLDIAKSDNTGSVSDFPSLRVTNTSSTQGNGVSTFNYARMDVKSGNGTVFADFGTRYDSSYSGAFIGTETSHPVALQTAGAERLRIDSSGNVSIGTATALSKLHVHGNLTLSNTTTATSAGTSTITPPATVAGYLTVSINGTSRKIPYYAT